jgi:hypothetical protein
VQEPAVVSLIGGRRQDVQLVQLTVGRRPQVLVGGRTRRGEPEDLGITRLVDGDVHAVP